MRKAKPARMTLTVEQELKVVKKIDRFLEENDKLDLFFDADELYEAIRECREILQEYEEIHVELQNELHDQYEVCMIDVVGPWLLFRWTDHPPD